MFCFGTKEFKFRHKVKTTQVVEREREGEPVRYHRRHRHGRENFYSNGRYYNESRSYLPRGVDMGRSQGDNHDVQQVRICNYRAEDKYLPRQHHHELEDQYIPQQRPGEIEKYHIEEYDRVSPADGQMVRYSDKDKRNDDEHQPYQSYYSAAPAQYPYHRPAVVPAAQHHHHYTYVTPNRTPKVLPSYYNSRDYDSRRYAAGRGAYSARRIKPADALPDDPFWCRERDGQWHLRTYYSIDRECRPGRWQMDAEKGFLVYHRD